MVCRDGGGCSACVLAIDRERGEREELGCVCNASSAPAQHELQPIEQPSSEDAKRCCSHARLRAHAAIPARSRAGHARAPITSSTRGWLASTRTHLQLRLHQDRCRGRHIGGLLWLDRRVSALVACLRALLERWQTFCSSKSVGVGGCVWALLSARAELGLRSGQKTQLNPSQFLSAQWRAG